MTDELALPQWAQAAKPLSPALPQWAQAAKPEPKGAVRQAVEQQGALTANIAKGVANDYQDAYGQSRDIAHAGLAQMQQPGVMNKVGGAADALRGGVGMTAAPLTAVWNALGMADPMMVGAEGMHAAGKAPEKPVAAPAIKSGEQVFTGPNHAAMREATGLKDPETGFVKPDGQFIGRKEAAAEAVQAGEAVPATTGKGLHSEDLPPEQKPSLVAPVGKDNAAPLPKWAQEFPADRAKTELKPVEQTKADKAAADKQMLLDSYAKSAPKVAEAKPFEPPQPVNTELPSNVTKLKTKPQSTYEKWFATLQKEGTHTNLPMDPEARITRAKAQGFNTDLTLYHGTGQNYMEFKVPGGSEPAVFLADNPKVSEAYAHKGAAPQIIPVWAKMVNPKTVDLKGAGYSGQKMSKLLAEAKAAGHDSVIIKNIHDIGGGLQNQYAFFEPGNLRAKYGAAFDPKVKSAQAHMLSSASASTSDILKGAIADREAGAVSEAGVINSLRRVGRVVKAILAPQTLDANAAKAAGQVRKALGTATRAAERDKATITAFQEHVRSFDMQDKLDIIDFMQSEKQLTQLGLSLPPEDAPLIQAMRDIFQGWKRKLEAAPSTEQMRFQEEYFPQQWKDPEKAVEFAKTFGTKEGSGGFTKAKKIPTVADGIRAGLEPVTHDPIDATLRYVDNVSRFLAVNEVFDDAVASSHVVWRAAGQEPAGWVKVDGRLSNKYPGQNAYAPEGWAAVYNNFTSRQPAGAFGDLLSGVQKISNSVTAFKLGLSGFHAMNMVGESFVGGIANAVDELASGHPIRALKGMATAPAKWITNPRKGAQMLKTYLSDIGSPELRKVVELATEANFRVAGKGRVADEYRFTAQGSLWESFRKGALKAEAAAAMRDIKGAPVAGTLKHLASTTARVLETVSDPLFKHYIPALKNGAYYDMLSTWLNAHPAATVEEQVAFARQAADIIDDRFGEMNQDNIFWQKWLKQVAQASMVSYSYEMGTFRSFAGAAEDLAKAPVRAVKGQPVWTPKMSYAFVALPVGVALMGATYQWLKTGKAPDKLMDLYYPQTGGKDAKSGLPERAVLPSYMSQVFNFAHDPRGELANKGNGAFELMRGAFSGTDWRGDPITLSTDSTGEALKKYMEFALKAWEPITFENRAKKGTALSGPERFTGIRSAPMFATDPKGYKAMEKGRADRADKLKKRHDETAKRVYGGTQ